jgi:hypothetical protein
MSRQLSPEQQEHTLMRGERNEQTRLMAALMGALVEQTIKEFGSGGVGSGAGASLAQLRKEFGDAIAVLTAHVRQTDRLISDGECDTRAQRCQRRSAVLVSVLLAYRAPARRFSFPLLEQSVSRRPGPIA